MPFLKKTPENEFELRQAITIMDRESSKKRRKDMQKRLDYYKDKQLQYLNEILNNAFQKPDQLKLQKEFYNVTSIVIDEISTIYSKEPIRKLVNANKSDEEIFEKIINESQFNLVMATANKYTKLCKNTLIRVVWRNERVEFDILTPNIYDVVKKIDNPTDIDALIYINTIDFNTEKQFNRNDKNTFNDPWANQQNIYYYWSDNKFIVFQKSSTTNKYELKIKEQVENTENINPYGVMPFVTLRDEYPTDEYFIEGGDNLINANEIINQKLTELNYLTKMQAFSQPCIKGDTKNTKLIIDPSMIITIPADDETAKNNDFYFRSPEAKIKELDDNIVKKLMNLSIKYGIDPQKFTPSAERSSSQSLQLQHAQQAEIVDRDKPFYRDAEKKIFELIKIVNNYHNEQKISDKAELFVDYVETEIPRTIEEEDQHNIIMHENGLISKKTWLMKENPDIKTEDDAQVVLDKIEKEKASNLEKNPFLNEELNEELNREEKEKEKEKEEDE